MNIFKGLLIIVIAATGGMLGLIGIALLLNNIFISGFICTIIGLIITQSVIMYLAATEDEE